MLVPIVLYLTSLDKLEGKHSICLITNIFGTECYGCGITKAVIACIKTEFTRAYQYNKLIVIVMPLIVFIWVKELCKLVKSELKKAS